MNFTVAAFTVSEKSMYINQEFQDVILLFQSVNIYYFKLWICFFNTWICFFQYMNLKFQDVCLLFQSVNIYYFKLWICFFNTWICFFQYMNLKFQDVCLLFQSVNIYYFKLWICFFQYMNLLFSIHESKISRCLFIISSCISVFILGNKFNIWNVHGIMITSGLLQSKWRPKGLTLTLQKTRSIHDSMNIIKIERITYIYILL